jgi:hypothetical protein
MGITIHYHGKIADLDRVEEFEDRVLDMALEIGAAARIWRTSPDADATRVVRGLLLDVAPGQETTSLLISPEGWLVPLHEIEAAENGTLDEPPYCWVKTQFGSVEGHVAVVELLSFLKQEFFPDLYVSDESGYWDDRDWKGLVDKLGRTQAMIDALADGLRAHPLSAEAAEDPEIVAARVERIARQVQQTLARPPEHPPVRFDDDGSDWDEVDDAQWDASNAFERERHPLQRLAADLDLRIFKLFENVPEGKSSHIGTLVNGVLEIGGGLAQALAKWDGELDGLQRGLALVQLKRALRGAAFAKGALYPVRAESLLSQEDFESLHASLQQLEDGIVGELTRIRKERER